MKPSLHPLRTAIAVGRWQRIALGIRLAYDPGKPTVIACYLGLGRRLIQDGLLHEQDSHRRMLRLLLQTGSDEGLPWAWRHHCLEYAVYPLAALRYLPDGSALEQALQDAQDRLPTTPRSAA